MKPFKKGRGTLSMTAITALILTLLVTVCFAGCEMASLIPIVRDPSNGGDAIKTEPPVTTDPVTTAPITTLPEPEIIRYFHPITGLETTEALSVLRPVAFSVSNTAYALPQFGIGDSDILFEFPIENGATRLVMMTSDYAKLEKIGPIRSTRSYIADILASFDAMQVFAGTSDTSASVIFEKYDTLDYLTQNLQSLCYRDTSRIMPHNLMTTGSLVSSEVKRLGYRTEIADAFALPYIFPELDKTALPGTTPCSELRLTYSASHNASFTYNPETGKYARYQLGEAHLDGNNGEQIAFSNVLILFSDSATYETANGTEFALTLSGGTGILVTGGTESEITWTFTDGALAMYDAEGNPLTVNRGSSYVGFVKVSDKSAVQIIR